MKRVVNAKWEVYGEYGGQFTNLDDAKRCAKFASTTAEYGYEASIWNIQDGMCYIDYENGKCVRDGWARTPLKKAGYTASFKLDGKVVEKPIYLLDGKEVIRHNNTILYVNTGKSGATY